MLWLVHAFVILFGLVIGSFLNVCIYRIPRQMSVVRPRSRCPRCNKPIKAWQNVPVLSYVWLRGRCADCGERISIQYPIVELITAGAFYLLFSKYGLMPAFWVNAAFFSILIALTVIDLFHRLLPDVLTISGVVLGFALAPFQSSEFFTGAADASGVTLTPVRYLESFLGVAFGAGLLWITAKLYFRVKKVEGMGYGDIKMMAMIGAFLGWRFALLTIFAGSLLGAVIGLAYIALSGKGRRYELPFGTFLGFGAAFVTMWGARLLGWYLSRTLS